MTTVILVEKDFLYRCPDCGKAASMTYRINEKGTAAMCAECFMRMFFSKMEVKE